MKRRPRRGHPTEDQYQEHLKERQVEETALTNFPKWSEVRADVVAAAGGEEAVAQARKRNQAYIDGHRLAERGEAPTVDAIAYYVQALG